MEELKLTVQEAVDALLMSQSSVYSWIDRGKLKTEETPTGKVIVISKNEVEKIKEYNLKSRRNKVAKQNIQNSDNFQENHIIDAEYSSNYEENVTNSGNETTYELAKLISELSAKAGKYELLADLQKEQKEDAKYWRDEYFKLQNDYKNLQKDVEIQKLEIAAKDKQIDELKAKHKGLFNLFNRKK